MFVGETKTAPALETDSDRSLHYSGRASRRNSTESRIGLLKCRRADICRVARCSRWIVLNQSENHASVNIAEISLIKNVIHFPTKLNSAPFFPVEVLKESQIIIEDRRKATVISRHVADGADSRS